MKNFRKRITARVKIAKVETSGKRTVEDKEVVLGDHAYTVNAIVDYNADFEPSSGDGFNEPHEGGYFTVGITIDSLKAFDENGSEITNEELLGIIQAQFLRLHESRIEEDISSELDESASTDSEPDPDREHDAEMDRRFDRDDDF